MTRGSRQISSPGLVRRAPAGDVVRSRRRTIRTERGSVEAQAEDFEAGGVLDAQPGAGLPGEALQELFGVEVAGPQAPQIGSVRCQRPDALVERVAGMGRACGQPRTGYPHLPGAGPRL